MFWSLGSFGELPKESGEAWQMHSGVLQDPQARQDTVSRILVGVGAQRV